jgi:hypothetical protein
LQFSTYHFRQGQDIVENKDLIARELAAALAQTVPTTLIIVEISLIALTDLQKGEKKAQVCDIA